MRQRPDSASEGGRAAPLQAELGEDELRQAETARAEVVDLLAQVLLERARLEGVVKHLPLGVVLLDAPSRRILLANARAQEIVGRTLLPGDEWAVPEDVGIHRPDGSQQAGVQLPAAGAPGCGEEVHEVIELRRPDRRVWVDLSSTSLVGGGREAVSVIVTLQDVTGRRRDDVRRRLLDATDEVLESGVDRRRLLRELVLRTVPDFGDWAAVDLFEGDRVVRLASAHAEHAEAAPARERRHPDEPRPSLVVQRVRASGAPFFRASVDPGLAAELEAEAAALGAVHPPSPTSYICVPVVVRGEVVAAFSFATSGSERRFDAADLTFAVELARRAALGSEAARLHGQLEAERNRLGRLVERFRDGVVTVTRDLVVGLANPSAQQVVGRELEPGRPLPEPWPEVFELRRFAAELFGRRARAVEARVSPAGRVMLELVGVPAAGEETAVIIIRDVTERERAEIAEREFVANAAHELRTPLTAITAAVEALELGAKDVPADRDRFLGHLKRECDRLRRLSESLLVLVRIQTGAQMPSAKTLEVRPLLERLAADLRPRPGVEVAVRCRDGLVIRADPALVDLALRNLAENAAKFTTGGRIELSASVLDGSVALEVADTGPGITPTDREHVFERFFRAAGKSGEGFGLGLSIASESVRAAGGTVELVSRSEPGTTVRLTFPRGRAQ